MFNLAPRGHGRSSFRVAEVIQTGRIPVYLYDDFPWVPYAGSAAAVDRLGLAGRAGDAAALVRAMGSMGAVEVAQRLRAVRAARYWYTYEGVMRQIALFFEQPLGGGGGADGADSGGRKGGLLVCAHAQARPPVHEDLAAMMDSRSFIV